MREIHDRLRFLRDRQGLKQSDVANAIGIKPSAYSTYENGIVPKLDTLIALATYFNVSLDYLIGISNEPRPATNELSNALGRLSKYADETPTESSFISFVKAATLYFRTGATCGKLPIEEFNKLLSAFTGMLQAAADDDQESVISSSKALQLTAYNLQSFPVIFAMNSKDS